MEFMVSFIYGLIQGITEFVPVSSSGHLAILPHLLHMEDPGVIFDLSMHVGTALAVIVYFKSDVSHLIISVIYFILRKKMSEGYHNYTCNFLVATISTFIVVISIQSIALKYGRSDLFIGINLAVFGVLMYLADRYAPTKNRGQLFKEINIYDSILIGISQGLAIFPGVSRSGITLTMARFRGHKRHEAASFSFLLSLPIILGGFMIKSPQLFVVDRSFNLLTCFLGALFAFFFGLLGIHLFFKIIKNMGLGIFAVYRVALAVGIFYFVLY